MIVVMMTIKMIIPMMTRGDGGDCGDNDDRSDKDRCTTGGDVYCVNDITVDSCSGKGDSEDDYYGDVDDDADILQVFYRTSTSPRSAPHIDVAFTMTSRSFPTSNLSVRGIP